MYDDNETEWQKLFEEIKPEKVIDILGTYAPIVYEKGKNFCNHFILCS